MGWGGSGGEEGVRDREREGEMVGEKKRKNRAERGKLLAFFKPETLEMI